MNKLKLYFLKAICKTCILLLDTPFLAYWAILLFFKYYVFQLDVIMINQLAYDFFITIIIAAFYIGDRIEKQNKQST